MQSELLFDKKTWFWNSLVFMLSTFKWPPPLKRGEISHPCDYQLRSKGALKIVENFIFLAEFF